MNGQKCGTPAPQNYQLYESNPNALPTATPANYCINIAFRIVRDDDGQNSFNPDNIPQILNRLNQDFAPTGISFVNVGTIDYINSTFLNHWTTPPQPQPIPYTPISDLPNCVNIFLISNSDWFSGLTSGTSNRIYLVKGASDGNTITHEMGHELNLMHTFQCSYKPVDPSCAENPNGSYSGTTGDQIEDTPADCFISGQTINGYTYPSPPYPISLYHPDFTNYMSYWDTTLANLINSAHTSDHFTQGQITRMKNAILNSPYLQSVRSNQCSTIDGPSYICSTGNYSFNIIAFGNPINFSWSVTGNLQIIGSNTGSNLIIKSSNSGNVGNATITLTINGTIVKTKTISIGVPINSGNVFGFYDWVSTNYGNIGLIAPTNPSITSFRWEIVEDDDFITNCSPSIKPRFIGASAGDPYNYSSTSNQAVINWGSCGGSYLIICYARNECGEMQYDSRYTDVGNPKNNPCFKNTVHTIIVPNPIVDKKVNIIVNKTIQLTPCNYRDLNQVQCFNRELDQIDNSVSIYDYNGNEIFRKVYDTNEFTIETLDLQRGNNYIVNLFTKEGGFTQQTIVVE